MRPISVERAIELNFRALAHARHEINEQRRVAAKPQQQRQREPAIRRRRERDRGRAVHEDVPDRGDGRGQRRAHRRAGLHDAIGNAAGEIVLKERPALPHHVPVRLPANEAGERRRDAPGWRSGSECSVTARPHDDEERPMPSEPAASARRTSGRAASLVTSVTTRPMNHGTALSVSADIQFDHEQGRKQPFRLPGKVPQEGDQRARRLRVLRRRRRGQESFKKLQTFPDGYRGRRGGVNRPPKARPAASDIGIVASSRQGC